METVIKSMQDQNIEGGFHRQQLSPNCRMNNNAVKKK